MIRIPYAQLPGGRIVHIRTAVEEKVWYRDWGCTSCGAALRLHRQRVPHGPRDHFEHRRKPERCEYVT
jgi:hypothetical protein